MKVFTHYTKITEQEEFLWRTLLQFGESWDIIGSVVMKNPGSAAVSRAVTDPETLQALQGFDENTSKETWFEFTPDQTMYCIRDLFREYYSARAQPGMRITKSRTVRVKGFNRLRRHSFGSAHLSGFLRLRQVWELSGYRTQILRSRQSTRNEVLP